MFAVVKASGFQRLVEVGSVISIDPTNVDSGGFVHFPVLLLVDGAEVVSDPINFGSRGCLRSFCVNFVAQKCAFINLRTKQGIISVRAIARVYVFSVTSIERGD